jgi:histidine triad (HIT) family protein
MDQTCLFCRIVAGEVPAKLAYEDDDVIAFYDIDPRAPVHVLIIPRKHIGSINDLTQADEPLVGRMHTAAASIARELGVADSGYRLAINCGPDANQTVAHIHLHILGGRPMKWPPG